MSFSLDTNQQSHLLIILNDINRLIYDAANAAAAAAAAAAATTNSGSLKPKGGGRGSRSKLAATDSNNNNNNNVSAVVAAAASLPDEITGFDQMNRQNLANFVVNTNQYFKEFFRFASVLIGKCSLRCSV